jgi:predicted nucleotidyltransferase
MTGTPLKDKELSLLMTVFQQHPEITKVVLFGSRAKGKFKPGSDIDLAVEGISNGLQIEALALELNDLPLPYKFDLKSLGNIQNSALLEHIERVGITIFPIQNTSRSL